jgi:putative holliday junction resolvase
VRAGRRIAVDVGDVRIGLATCDPAGLIATPLETVAAGDGDLREIRRHVAEQEAVEVVVGLPRSLAGGEGPAAAKARRFAAGLVEELAGAGAAVPVRLVDERLSTVTAESQLRAGGRQRNRRRAVVDQAAAVVILQNALDTERSTGRAPGEPVREPGETIDEG